MMSAVVHAVFMLMPTAEVGCTNKQLALELTHMCPGVALNAENLALYGNGMTRTDVMRSRNNSINVVGTRCHRQCNQRLAVYSACTTFT